MPTKQIQPTEQVQTVQQHEQAGQPQPVQKGIPPVQQQATILLFLQHSSQG